jgi:hypothetical protein
MALEFNIAPASDVIAFDTRIDQALKDIRSIVSDEFTFEFCPVADFIPSEWARASKKAKVLGCDPDYDAYLREAKTPPQSAKDNPFRTASGHIHIGYTEGMSVTDPMHIFDCSIITQLIDHKLGQYERLWDADTRRKAVYGQFGSFRPKPYGLEYRVLSNVWVDKPGLRRFIFEYIKGLVERLFDSVDPFKSPYYGFKYPANKIENYMLNNSNIYGLIQDIKGFGSKKAWDEFVSLYRSGFFDTTIGMRHWSMSEIDRYVNMGFYKYY